MKKLLFIIPLIIALGFGGIAVITSAYGNSHPDACQPCHGAATTVNDVKNNLWSHDIESGGNVWNNCGSCHNSLQTQIQNTPHSGIGCKCHAVLHAGYNATNNIYGVAFYMVPSENIGTSLGKVSPGASNLVKKQLEFDETNLTSVAQYYGWGTDGMEIEVGLVNHFSKQFITVSADGSVTSNGWQVCFNCHFISTNPANVGAFKFVDGVWKIGIPQEALSMNPHAVSEIDVNTLQPGNEATGLTANMLPLTVSIIMGLIGALVAVFGRK